MQLVYPCRIIHGYARALGATSTIAIAADSAAIHAKRRVLTERFSSRRL
jgi:hypothetical protein